MITRLKCSQGHAWEPSALSSAPLVCPQCGRPPLPSARAHSDAEQTVDFNAEHTIDHPAPTPLSAPHPSEVTQTMHFTPPPSSPAQGRSGNSVAGLSGISGRSSAGTSPFAKSDGSPSAPPALSMPFTIIRQHARGGLGLVNLARDKNINREVALKQILPQHVDNLTLQKRFLYEAQITGQLEHPSIVPVYCLGSDDLGNPYYVMRFVKGRTLDAIITDHHVDPNPIVFRELLRRFYAVCQAVAYAHSRGVIHRDLKPANIMLGDYDETLVLDWGLAKDIKNKTDPAFFDDPTPSASHTSTIPGGSTASHANTSEVTMQGQIIGTPAYMAPEQAEGRTELHGPVTDIYALGGILYKILAGNSPTPPAGSMTAPGGQRRLNFVASPPPSSVKKDIHPILEQICMRAMATDPAARYPRALELAQDIKRWLDEHPLILRPATPATKFLAFLRANVIPLLIIIFGLMAIIIALLVAGHDH
jgi:serine/threonine protein kinase